MEMMESKIMSSTDCGKTVSEFNGQVDSEVKKLQVEFEVFDQKLHCLDEFYFQKVWIQNYKTLSFWKSYLHSVMDKLLSNVALVSISKL